MPRTGFAALFILFALSFTACDSSGPQPAVANPPGAESAATAEVVTDTNTAAAPDERMVDAVKSRKAVLTVLKDNFVPLALMVRGRIDYDADTAQRYANRLPVMIGMMEERFATDTRGSGVETEALDEIWEDMDAFLVKIDNAHEAANHLAMVAGDEAQFNDAVLGMRDACGSCHDDFRVDDD